MKPIKVKSKEIDGETWFKFDNKYDKARYFYSNILTVVLIILMIALGIGMFYFFYSNWEYIKLLKINPCSLCRDIGFECFKIR